MVNFENKDRYGVEDLRKLISVLRGPGGCPWDAEQTHESIRRNFLEEAYEAVEAIDEQDPTHLCEELGDVLMQVMFHADIEADAGRFNLDDVADMTVKKLISRHPHVFGDVAVSGSGDVLANWDVLKRIEKHQETVADSLAAVAKSLPGLWRAEKIQKKASKVGFDWPDAAGALDKLQEELDELADAVRTGGNTREELGDLFFSAVNVGRFLKIDPEEAVQASCDKFILRFRHLEAAALAQGRKLEEMTLQELDELYKSAKLALENKYDA
ncbi:tetrapyrrole methylase family protein / MazG family protein [Sporobacter termitidis DSM 10068]|uniref:Tetrapyrrole methylase family protein / MazG family protein n=1 Tax=Sporobacter termitidis DSM 10068 TaxID=1123282 RepID=A0A1M5VNE9_9FIRM|nr:nucleoside triphosphate pyrophosphohydrolase [Sporobacter termitidis]SHH76740.1 tetrapyrrole methylase family protein / MazG family protein [Sporobacter termitidis DSM 10068]